MKKLISLLACIAMLLGLLAGCGSGAEVETTETEAAAAAEEAGAADNGIHINLGGTGYGTYAPDTVVGTVNGTDVTWMEYYYWLNYFTNYYLDLAASYGIEVTGWDAVNELSSEETNADAFISLAQYRIRQYHALLTEFEDAGIVLTDEDRAQLEAVYNDNCDTDGDGEASEDEIAAFEEYLAANNVDRDFFLYLNEVTLLSDKAFDAFFGEDGAYYPDDAVMEYIEGLGAMYAKHILFLTVDEDTREPLDEDTIAQKRDTAAALQAELSGVEDDKDALSELFDEYMAEYTEDSGTESYPDGYLFFEGDMIEEFENAVKALDVNYGLSDVVESQYGYHIILRMPILPDDYIGTDSYGGYVTFRQAAAEEQYAALVSAWTDSAEAEWEEGFGSPDMAAIFG